MANKTDSRGRKTVLIVEDQAALRRTLRKLLQDVSRFVENGGFILE